MITISKVNYPALGGTEKRKLYVYTPLDYEYEPDAHFPVLYMFDGHNVFYDEEASFGKSWGVGRYLDYIRARVIVVALECNQGENNERLSEYSPYDFYEEGLGSFEGHGKETMDWFVKVLKPRIDRKYRTIPDREHTFIAGSSMGGLMSLYAVLRYNRTFSRAAALSPTLWLNYDKLCNMARSSKLVGDTIIYMDYGTEEVEYSTRMVRHFSDYAKHLMTNGIAVTARIVPGGDHSEGSWERQLAIVFDTLLYEY